MLNYGSNFNPPMLNAEEIGAYDVKEKKSIWKILNFGLMALQLPLMFATGGLSTMATLAVEGALGAAQTTIDYKSGNGSIWSSALNFSGVAGGLLKGASNLKKAGSMFESVKDFNKGRSEIEGVKNFLTQSMPEKYGGGFLSDFGKEEKFLNIVSPSSKGFEDLRSPAEYIEKMNNIQNVKNDNWFRRFNKGSREELRVMHSENKKIMDQLVDNRLFNNNISKPEKMFEINDSDIKDFLKNNKNFNQKDINAWKKWRGDTLGNSSRSQTLNGELTNHVNFNHTKYILNDAGSKMYNNYYARTIGTNVLNNADNVEEEIKGFTKRYGGKEFDFRAIFNSLNENGGSIMKSARRFKNSVLEFLENQGFTKNEALNIYKNSNIYKTVWKNSKINLGQVKSKTMGSVSKVLGIIQSPGALASEVISKTVSKITAKFEVIGEKVAESSKKYFKIGAKTLKTMEDDFVKTGGILMKSKWIMGYKLLNESPLTATILINFNPLTTKSNSLHLRKGKKPVVVTLPLTKLKRFLRVKHVGRWYINNIAKSRGGRNGSSYSVIGKLEQYLGMLPINEVNEVLGFAAMGKGFWSGATSGAHNFMWDTQGYISGLKDSMLSGILGEAAKSIVGLSGFSNQYIKQALEGTLSGTFSGGGLSGSLSNSAQSAFLSGFNTAREDKTIGGGISKNFNVIKGSAGTIKTIRG